MAMRPFATPPIKHKYHNYSESVGSTPVPQMLVIKFHQELRGSIRVFCRIRPPKQLTENNGALGVKAEGSRSICLKKPPGDLVLKHC